MTLLIILLLVAMLAVVLLGTQGQTLTREFESVTIPVRVNDADNYIRNNHRLWVMQEKFIQFLEQELGIPGKQVELAKRQVWQFPSQLPMVLWQYGLIELWQLERILDWLETV